MPKPRDLTMLKADSHKFLIAMATAEMEPIKISKVSGVQQNIVYAARKGCYVKPIYIGKIAKVLGVPVTDLI